MINRDNERVWLGERAGSAMRPGFWSVVARVPVLAIVMMLLMIPGLGQRAGSELGDSGGRTRVTERILPAGVAVIDRQPESRWYVTGPFGGDVISLAIDPRQPDRLLAGTTDGQLYRSVDGGKVWRHLSPGLAAAGFSVTVIHFDAEQAGTIYVGARAVTEIGERISGGGLYRSDDDGQTWREIAGLHGRAVRGLSQARSNPRVLAVAALDAIYLSPDRGETWQRITPNNHPDLRNFHSVAIDPRHPDSIYAGTSHLPWKTTDGGRSWQRAGSQQTGMIDDSDIFSIRIDPRDPEVVLMSACSGIYRSLDASGRWSKLAGIPFSSRRTQIIQPHPTRPETLFAGTTEGLWVSKSAGRTDSWKRVTPARLVVNAIAIHPAMPDRVFLGTEDSGVLVSLDGGESFVTSSEGFVSRQVTALLADRTAPGHLYAGIIFDGEAGGLFRSTDGGMTWHRSMSGMGDGDVYALHQSPRGPATIYAGTNEGLFRSDDRGQTWTRVLSSPKPAPATRQRRQTPPAGSRNAGGKGSRRSLPQTEAPGMVDLVNHVTSLASLTPSGSLVSSAPASAQIWLLAATREGLFVSANLSEGWRRLIIPGQTARPPVIRTLATSPIAPGMVAVGTEEGLYISHDNGASFRLQILDEERRRIRCVIIDPRDPRIIHTGTTTGFFRTSDGGVSWEQRGGGMPMHTNVSTLILDSRDPDHLSLTDDLRGALFVSRDRGTNWERHDLNHLPDTLTRAVTTDPFEPSRLYFGGFSGGISILEWRNEAANRQPAGQTSAARPPSEERF